MPNYKLHIIPVRVRTEPDGVKILEVHLLAVPVTGTKRLRKRYSSLDELSGALQSKLALSDFQMHQINDSLAMTSRAEIIGHEGKLTFSEAQIDALGMGGAFELQDGGREHTTGDRNCQGCVSSSDEHRPRPHRTGPGLVPSEAANCSGLVHAEEFGNVDKGGSYIVYLCDECGENPE